MRGVKSEAAKTARNLGGGQSEPVQPPPRFLALCGARNDEGSRPYNRRMRRVLSFAIVVTLLSSAALAQSLVERLGYPKDTKLLIVHADDLGLAHSVNAASTKALESGLVTSGSIMVPCPWLSEIATWARAHPDADLGIHITLTSEWAGYRWGPLSAGTTLVDNEGYLRHSEREAAKHIDPRQVEAEIRAQIARARALGIKPTHIDSHMGTLFQTNALFEVMLRVSRAEHLPARISRSQTFATPMLKPDDVVIDHIISIGSETAPADWARFYTDEIRKLQPGVTEIVAHLAYDDEEMRAVTADHPQWGAAWRQRDFDFLTSEQFRRVLRENNVKLITWREIGAKLGGGG
jgi:predicted glycoside hydrolase/deacetylase ChbG (UPF0249 family)